MYIYNTSSDVIRFSESVENGRRVARYISNKVFQLWNAENIDLMVSKIFRDTAAGQKIRYYPLNSDPEGDLNEY